MKKRINSVVYYFLIEAVPSCVNPEICEVSGAYVNCWVKAETKAFALIKIKEHLKEENWLYVRTEDVFIAERERYIDIPESLECYDFACENGIGSIFYTWLSDDDVLS